MKKRGARKRVVLGEGMFSIMQNWKNCGIYDDEDGTWIQLPSEAHKYIDHHIRLVIEVIE